MLSLAMGLALVILPNQLLQAEPDTMVELRRQLLGVQDSLRHDRFLPRDSMVSGEAGVKAVAIPVTLFRGLEYQFIASSHTPLAMALHKETGDQLGETEGAAGKPVQMTFRPKTTGTYRIVLRSVIDANTDFVFSYAVRMAGAPSCIKSQ